MPGNSDSMNAGAGHNSAGRGIVDESYGGDQTERKMIGAK